MISRYPKLYYTLLFIFFVLIAHLGLFVERHHSYALMITYGAACVAYVFLLQAKRSQELLFGLGVALRLALFLSMPILSDDIYRFIWDGTLLKNGIHPFEHLPGHYLDQNVPGITLALFDRLNSPGYFTVYPPVNQFVFWLSVVVGGSHWLISANVVRLFLIAADLGSFWFLKKLLKKYNKPERYAMWFFLHPLIILEFVGNLHFEGLVICFLLAGIYFYELGKKWSSATSLGLAIGTKLLPYIYLPYFFLKGLKESKWSISILAGVVSVVTLLPLLNEHFISGMQNSLYLYFRRFEFNASIYYLAREWGYAVYGYNNIAKIGPTLSIFSIISIVSISVVGALKNWPIPKTLLFILTTYLFLATTVHPWYILPLVVLGILSGYFYPFVWSFFIFITYLGYTKDGYHLPLMWVFFEYLAVFLAVIMELFQKRIASYRWVFSQICR